MIGVPAGFPVELAMEAVKIGISLFLQIESDFVEIFVEDPVQIEAEAVVDSQADCKKDREPCREDRQRIPEHQAEPQGPRERFKSFEEHIPGPARSESAAHQSRGRSYRADG